jgi:hypothetical protein
VAIAVAALFSLLAAALWMILRVDRTLRIEAPISPEYSIRREGDG